MRLAVFVDDVAQNFDREFEVVRNGDGRFGAVELSASWQ